MHVTQVTITIVVVPQIEPLAPYRSRIRSTSTTTKAIVQVATDEGISGLGEANFNFVEGVSGRRMQAEAQSWLTGRDPLRIHEFHQECPLETRLKSGVEIALWDILGKSTGKSVSDLCGAALSKMLGGDPVEEVEAAACMGIQSYELAGELAHYYVEQGFSTLKTKAGSDMQEDLEMVRGIRDAVGDRLKLRIDPNCGYSRKQSAELAQRLEEYDLEYLEQPLPDHPLEDAVWLRSQSKTPLALNESVTDPASVNRILEMGAADFILPDTHIAGGILPCLEIGWICQAARVPCIMHCGHDLGPKTAAMIHIAAALPSYSLANDTTYYGLESDILTTPLRLQRGKFAVPSGPGLGIELDKELLQRYCVEC
ncbi:MAG TPA: mandelate racemase/muconate lactonizing enzyme family protein [Planctomycetaceae bacterium]|nr:mandelate racemase/muconate lactonizing enzyme family protein [Planctomycetaceae bacterium]